MPDYVAELIDQAVSDASVGPDAVRCIPEPLAIPVADDENDLEALNPPVIDLVEAFVVFDEHHVWRPEVEAAPAGAVVFAWRDRKCIYVVREPLLVPPGVSAYVGYEAPLH